MVGIRLKDLVRLKKINFEKRGDEICLFSQKSF